MANGQLSTVIRFLHALATPRADDGTTDRQLLRRFVTRRDEAAFTTLMQRHGPMVWGVCQRLLHDSPDAEDAFQATFLVLVRKAGSIRKPELLGNWLYGVAYRAALKARAEITRRRMHERQVVDMAAANSCVDAVWADLRPVLDEEVSRLPDRYRVPFVLCYLEGRTNEEAARLLGCPKGTVLSRLARARARLQGRLTRRGLALSAAALLSALSANAASATAPAGLMSATIEAAMLAAMGDVAAAGAFSAKVAGLTKAVLQSLLLTKLKVAAAWLLVVATLGVSASGFGSLMVMGKTPDLLLVRASDLNQEIDKRIKIPELEGQWKIEFANGVKEVCQVRKDRTVSVTEPARTASGEAVVKEGSVVIVYQDDRVERWTPVGKRMVVEHWFPGGRFPRGRPVVGIGARFLTNASEIEDLIRTLELEGRWHVEFANGVQEVCEVRKDGTASVTEPARTSSGKADAKDGSIVIVYQDDRVERWTPVGKKVVVEHWYPGAGFPSGRPERWFPPARPVLGIAVQARTDARAIDTRRTREGVDRLKANLDNFGLFVTFSSDARDPYGSKEPYGTIELATHCSGKSKTPPHWLGCADLGKDGAAKVIDHLAASGFFDRATPIALNDQHARVRFYSSRTKPYYSLLAGAASKDPQYHEILGWDEKMRERLEGLRKVLDGDAARLMDKLLLPLQLDGVWQVESLQEDGKAAPDEKAITEVAIKSDKLIFKYARLKHEAVNTISLDPSRKSIDITAPGLNGPLLGIYQLEGDTLKLCWSTNPERKRPDAFVTKENSGRRLAVLKRKKSVNVQISDWGKGSKGLQCRVQAPTAIQQGMPLEIQLEWRSQPTKLEPGVKQLNAFLYSAFVELVLTYRTTGKRLNVKPHDPTQGMPVDDRGSSVTPLDERLPKPWPITFPLVQLGSTLQPGSYDGAVEYSFPQTPTPWWRGTGAEWDQAGFWHGTVRSGWFRLEVRKETPRTQTFSLPKTLRLENGLKVGYGPEDTEKVTLPVRNGYIVGTRLYRNGQEYRLTTGPLWPEIDQWSDYKKGEKKVAYTIEIFETADPPVHGWHPGPGTGGYKVLWNRTFTLSLTEEEIRKLQTLKSRGLCSGWPDHRHGGGEWCRKTVGCGDGNGAGYPSRV